jgi:exosortase
MPELTQLTIKSQLRFHLPFAILMLASMTAFWTPLRALLSLSLADDRYSQIVLVPFISGYFLYRERHTIFSRTAFRPAAGLVIWAVALGVCCLLAAGRVQSSADGTLSVFMLAILLVWSAGFAGCYGFESLRAARFAFLFSFLLVPIPSAVMDKIVGVLQRGSAELTYTVLRLAGVPMFREGTRFSLPGLGIEIAKECSSIHSSWALFIMGLLLGHLFLNTIWAKAWLSILTIPIAMFTNSLRIVTLWFLGTHVDAGFFYGNLHHRGGALFSLISCAALLFLLYLLRRIERRRHPCGFGKPDHESISDRWIPSRLRAI